MLSENIDLWKWNYNILAAGRSVDSSKMRFYKNALVPDFDHKGSRYHLVHSPVNNVFE